MDIVLSVKAAGVKIIWSFLNSYDIIKGYEDSNENWADYARHIEMQTKRVTYSGLMLSNTSFSRTLSGRREIWFERTTSYYWYAKMLDKDTDQYDPPKMEGHSTNCAAGGLRLPRKENSKWKRTK
ncbi:MAG: hypothetical protein IJ709_00830 [Selenomonas sp.]|nr:hypothetical protein [Selenomonas sp.]